MSLEKAVAEYHEALNQYLFILGRKGSNEEISAGKRALDAAVRAVALAAVGLALRPFNQHGWADIKAEINRLLPEGSGKVGDTMKRAQAGDSKEGEGCDESS